MQCPVCEVDLLMTERQGVEIDYCPKCRGIWLDRGELDKIIERAGGEYGTGPAATAGHADVRPQPGADRQPAYDAPPAGREQPQYSEPQDHREHERYHDHHGHDRDYDPRYDKRSKKKKATSFLEDMFDF